MKSIRSLLLIACALVSYELSAASAYNCGPEPTEDTVQYGDEVSCELEILADVDVFHFLGTAGDNLEILITNTNAASGNMSTSLRDPNGVEIAHHNASSVNDLSVALTENGIYTLLVTARNGAENYQYLIQIPCIAGKCATAIPPDTLGYTAVDPCRIVDTRYGVGGSISGGETRHFVTYGDVQAQNQLGGGAPASYPDECPFSLGEHAAVHINVAVVPLGPSGQGGYMAVWPNGEPQPTSSFMNYKAGVQNIANAGTVKTRSSDLSTPDISLFASRDVHVIIDVLGYYTE